MNNAELIEQFKTKTAERLAMYDLQLPPRQAIQREFNALAEADWKKTQGRKKFSMVKALELLPHLEEMKIPFQARVDALFKQQVAERAALDKEIDELAEKIQLTDDLKVINKSDWAHYGERSTYDYSTQGFGAEKYARAAAEGLVDHVKACGFDAEIREKRKEPTISCGWSMSSVEFHVFANCDAAICKIIERKPGLTLREWVRLQWKRGVNPRVTNPFLKIGYEESVGLDYFGGEIKREVPV